MKKIIPIVFIVALLQLVAITDSHAAPPAWGDGDGGTYYTVRYGDTLFKIGRQFGVNPYHIASANRLRNPNYIYAGQVLYIPAGDGWNDGWQGGCGNNCGRRDGCGNNCGQRDGCGNNCDWNRDCGNNCDWNSGCGNNCGNRGYNYNYYGYGYDYTGYYYDSYYPGQNYQRYSYTCGYNYNCY